MSPARLTTDDIAAWVIKTRTPPEELAADWSAQASTMLTRCVRRSYRVGLMRPGQRCLLWLSGQHRAGVHAIGVLRSPALPPESADSPYAVDVELRLLPEPVPRQEWRADPALSRAEVLRMPAGANPSYLDSDAYAALCTLLPSEARAAAGW